MSSKIKNQLFFLICFTLIFNNIPKVLQMNFIGSVLGDKLVFYPLIIGFVYTIYCEYKYKNVLVNVDKFINYIVIYVSLIMLSSIIGLYTYPYYDLIFSGPVEQIEKLPKVLSILQSFGINIEEKTLLILWIIIRVIKGLLLETIYTFGGAYMIYCWYHNNWQQGFKILSKAIICSITVILLYSSIEIFYLAGNKTATEILAVITPFFHVVLTAHDWWPPLLWKEQLRSIFAEPSFLGIYAAFVIPFLWYKFMVNKDKYKIVYSLIITFFIFLVFLTKARTAIALFSGEVCILLLYMVYLRNKIFIKNVMLICTCIVISFISANIFISNMANTKTNTEVGVEQYFEDNLGSLASTEKRSNTARYSIILANLNIGIDYPVLGVGLNLNDAYIPDYLPEMSENNHEVNMWINDQKEMGILKSGFPNLCEYSSRFSETGFIGLIIFLIPAILLLKCLIIKILDKKIKYKEIYVFYSISFIGILAAGMSNSINVVYCYWVLLGLGYAMCFGKLNRY